MLIVLFKQMFSSHWFIVLFHRNIRYFINIYSLYIEESSLSVFDNFTGPPRNSSKLTRQIRNVFRQNRNLYIQGPVTAGAWCACA